MPVSRRRHDAIVLGLVSEAWSLRRQLAAAVERAERAEANMRTMARQIDDLTGPRVAP